MLSMTLMSAAVPPTTTPVPPPVIVNPAPGPPSVTPEAVMLTMLSTHATLLVAGRRPFPASIVVFSAPCSDRSVIAFEMQMMHDSFSLKCSSPGAVNAPSPFRSPYRPAPTSITSPSDAFSMAALMDRHGLLRTPQEGLSRPLLATHHVVPV